MQHTRLASVKGVFYPDSCTKLSIYFKKFREYNKNQKIPNITPRAIIVPHAGYVYSGFTANQAYEYLIGTSPKRLIIIGPSHRHYFKGISASYYEEYETPCGNIPIDTNYLIKLSQTLPIGFEPKAHTQEHSTEVQMPFIHHYLPKTPIIELIYGDTPLSTLSHIITTLLEDKNNILVISTDLSHFHTKTKAKEHDIHCIEALKKLSIPLLKSCEACGLLGLKALLLSAKQKNLTPHLLDYRTSADYSQDESRVVGYMSAVLSDA